MTEKNEVSPEELKRLLDAGRVNFMFDLRNKDEFGAWRIEGRSDFETLNIPQIKFVGEEEKYLGRKRMSFDVDTDSLIASGQRPHD